MKRYIVLVIFICLASISVHAEMNLQTLDRALKTIEYQVAKENIIEEKKIEAQAAEDSSELLFWKLSEIRDEYAFYQIDSAMVYSLKSYKVAKYLNRSDLLSIAELHVVEEYIHLGMYIEAKQWLDEIDKSDVPDFQLESYYYKYNALYESLSDYTDDLELKHIYRQKEYAYKDSISMVSPENIYIKSALYAADNQDERSINILMEKYNVLDENDRSIGPLAYAISQYYRRHGDRVNEKRYLTISAVSDLKCSVKEYLSLRRLSEILYEEGDFSRAHTYILRCMDDAMFSGARLRLVQVSSVLPLLEAAYQQKLNSRILVISISAFIILALLVVVSILLRQKHRQEKELDIANKQLAESGAIKNIYIFNLLMECVSRIDTLDKYRKDLKRKAINGEKSALLEALKSTTLVDEQWNSFYSSFDSTFLQIFPTFIDGVNNLMTPEKQFEKSETLSVELRILALIRLGIDDTERIASVLKYSKATIYSYRSRIRIKAKNPKEFEHFLMDITSI